MNVFDPTSRVYTDLISTALQDFGLNETNADTTPKQQVVNGWVARDLLQIIAYQNVDLLDAMGALGDQNAAQSASGLAVRDDRIPALLLLAVIGIAWIGITTSGPEFVYVEEELDEPESYASPSPD